MSKLIFECNNCNQQLLKWQGCCPSCKSWNTIVEQQVFSKNQKAPASNHAQTMQQLNCATDQYEFVRILANFPEWDRVLGGGIVQGSINILTGDPGIGKSTLLLQVAHQLAKNYRVFYFSSEESLHQVANRAGRIIGKESQLYFLAENNLDNIIATIQKEKPDLIIIDSIQNCFLESNHSNSGSINQLRDAGLALMQIAKTNNIAIFLTAHITKEGQMAGPKTLEHMVDTVFYLQGEDRWQIRVLRAVKNRFGPINELGFFEMHTAGLQQVEDINKLLLESLSNAPGAALVSYLEGTRPLLLELQALTLPTKLNIPQRVITGIEHKHVILIAAILEKYLKIKFSNQDIFFKVSGNFKIKSNTADLGIALALISSHLQVALPEKTVALGELSLTGSIKPINQIGAHIKEAERFGIKTCIIPKGTKIPNTSKIDIVYISNAYELLNLFHE
jgi:DNA repair protein RadA/Sms